MDHPPVLLSLLLVLNGSGSNLGQLKLSMRVHVIQGKLLLNHALQVLHVHFPFSLFLRQLLIQLLVNLGSPILLLDLLLVLLLEYVNLLPLVKKLLLEVILPLVIDHLIRIVPPPEALEHLHLGGSFLKHRFDVGELLL